jgi:hypothetical protein
MWRAGARVAAAGIASAAVRVRFLASIAAETSPSTMREDVSEETSDEFLEGLATLGFVLVQRDRKGTLQLARMPNQHLTEWVHDDRDEALFTWEFDLGEFVASMEWQIGAAETSFQILFPQFDVKIERDVDAVAAEITRLEGQLSNLDLAHPAL